MGRRVVVVVSGLTEDRGADVADNPYTPPTAPLGVVPPQAAAPMEADRQAHLPMERRLETPGLVVLVLGAASCAGFVSMVSVLFLEPIPVADPVWLLVQAVVVYGVAGLVSLWVGVGLRRRISRRDDAGVIEATPELGAGIGIINASRTLPDRPPKRPSSVACPRSSS